MPNDTAKLVDENLKKIVKGVTIQTKKYINAEDGKIIKRIELLEKRIAILEKNNDNN